MILLLLLDVVTSIIDGIFNILPVFELGEDIIVFLDKFMLVLDKGLTMFSFFVGPVCPILLGYVLAIESIRHAWQLIWFVIRKIPFLNISQ